MLKHPNWVFRSFRCSQNSEDAMLMLQVLQDVSCNASEEDVKSPQLLLGFSIIFLQNLAVLENWQIFPRRGGACKFSKNWYVDAHLSSFVEKRRVHSAFSSGHEITFSQTIQCFSLVFWCCGLASWTREITSLNTLDLFLEKLNCLTAEPNFRSRKKLLKLISSNSK